MSRLSDLENKKRQIEEQISDLKKVKHHNKPRSLDEITPLEKIKGFDKIYAITKRHFDETLDGEADDDTPHYIYEEAMQSTLGQKIFETMNKFSR